MLTHQTAEKLVAMRLSSMGKEYRRQLELPETTALSFDERFGMLVDAEWTARNNSRLGKLLRLAQLRIPGACLEDLDYDPRRKLDRGYVARLADCSWMNEHRNIIVTGATGTGKTYLACAFGNAACRQGLKVKYYRINRLLTDLAIGRGDGSYNRLMRELKKTELLLLDDWGMATLDPVSSRDLLEVVEDRFGCRSTVISGQLPVRQWHEIFEDSTVADAVLDRLVHNSHRFELFGPSKRGPDHSDPENRTESIANPK
jgi:DNA replication protein DnaC